MLYYGKYLAVTSFLILLTFNYWLYIVIFVFSLYLLYFSCVCHYTDSRDGNSAAYAAARCCWCTAPRSVATKICITSQHQRSAAYKNFFTFFLPLLSVIFSLWTIMVSLDVTIIRYELKTCMLLKQEKVPSVQVYFFRIRSILESAILATRNLVLIGWTCFFFDTNKKILVLVG